jgi:hypothetical protein
VRAADSQLQKEAQRYDALRRKHESLRQEYESLRARFKREQEEHMVSIEAMGDSLLEQELMGRMLGRGEEAGHGLSRQEILSLREVAYQEQA